MMKLDRMLMIGSAGANVGKTELACALIRKFSKSKQVIGIKVTTIKAKDGKCPRGGKGCGVCSLLEGDFAITEEADIDSEKDTARLMAAGASQVFWLRVMKEHLKQGISDLLSVVGSDAVLVCESNSLRQVVEPGLFLMVKSRSVKKWKASARDVKEYADKIVISDGSGFDFDIGRIKVADGKWTMPEKATAIIMAGGGSGRMGTDKSMLFVGGRPMIETIYEQLRGSFEQILISADEGQKYDFLGVEVVRDRVARQGPLMGIASAVEASASELNFVVACDIPRIEMSFVRRMLAEAEGADIVIPNSGEEKYEPLFAVYCKSALEAINEVLRTGGRKIVDAFSRCKVRYIELGEPEWFVNINTKVEYEKFQKKYYD
ncbi:molybdenum cofactor guanylyltransferase [Planctomycetota bacterium]